MENFGRLQHDTAVDLSEIYGLLCIALNGQDVARKFTIVLHCLQNHVLCMCPFDVITCPTASHLLLIYLCLFHYEATETIEFGRFIQYQFECTILNNFIRHRSIYCPRSTPIYPRGKNSNRKYIDNRKYLLLN